MYILEGFRLKCVCTSIMTAFSHFSLNVVPLYTTRSKKVVSVSDISAVNFIAIRAVGSGLSLRAGGWGFSPATERVAPGYFYWKIEEK